ncbi:MAG: 3-oxoacyl-ACP reductase FabG [Myxococcota bacterium]
MDLSSKVAIVTGGSRGIGKAIALELGTAGAKVIVNYNRNAEGAQKVADSIDGIAIQADVSTEAGCTRLIEAAQSLGSLDILVNNAGINADGLLVRMTDSDWSTVLTTNLDSTFRLCRSATEIMMQQRSGSIINITSVSGLRGNAGQANYSASKAAVAAMSVSLAKEMGRRGIRVNCVAPGFVATDMVDAMNPKVVAAAKSMIAMRRLAEPSEIAKVVRFLASDDASYVTGQEWVVDGGLT